MQSILSQIGSRLSLLKKRIAEKTLVSLVDVDPNVQNLGVLQYNSLTGIFTSQPPELIGAVLDGGNASTIHLEALTIDGGGA